LLARSDGEVVDGHLRSKAARKLGIDEIPVILCYEWKPAQVKAFGLLVNRSVTWAAWDEELLALELQELSEADFDLGLTGFNPGEIDGLLAIPDEEGQRDTTGSGASSLPSRRPVSVRTTPSALRGCHQPGGGSTAPSGILLGAAGTRL
jgi:hypothetical protein